MQQFVCRSERFWIKGISDQMAALLHARGVQNEEEAQAFLHPDLSALHDPLSLHGMKDAIALFQAFRKKAVVYGDYDVDGVCASVLLHDALTEYGIDTDIYIPDRHTEGYGLNMAAVEELSKKYQLLVTVDCGITASDEVAAARRAGMKVVVSDHHKLQDTLPQADALIDPFLEDEQSYSPLCGTGVAWKIAEALLGRDGAMKYIDLAAFATIADLVPLTGENRVIVKFGLEKMKDTARIGLRELLKVSGVEGDVTSDRIAFGAAPRINAGGRLKSAEIGKELLLETDPERAFALAQELDALNRERQNEERRVLAEAEAQLAQYDIKNSYALVLCGENWNSGVVGLAAGRLAEKYARPSVVLSREDDWCVGSARSACDVDLFSALRECGDVFVKFGGHKQAAGMTVAYKNLSALRDRLNEAVKAQLNGRKLEKQVPYDCRMALSDVTSETVEELKKLEPFGMGNPAPAFLAENVHVEAMRAVGAQGAHLKMTLSQNDAVRDGIAFSLGALASLTPRFVTCVFTPTLNTFNGRTSAECRVAAIRTEDDSFEEARAFLQDFYQERANNTGYALPCPTDVFVSTEQLRNVWKCLAQKGNCASLSALSDAMALSRGQALCALEILCEIGIADYSFEPFSASAVRGVKRSPDESRLYQYLIKQNERSA